MACVLVLRWALGFCNLNVWRQWVREEGAEGTNPSTTLNCLLRYHCLLNYCKLLPLCIRALEKCYCRQQLSWGQDIVSNTEGWCELWRGEHDIQYGCEGQRWSLGWWNGWSISHCDGLDKLWECRKGGSKKIPNELTGGCWLLQGFM